MEEASPSTSSSSTTRLHERLSVGAHVKARLGGNLVGGPHVRVKHLRLGEQGEGEGGLLACRGSERALQGGASRVQSNNCPQRRLLLTSLATGSRPGWAIQVPSWPSLTSRSLSARTLANAACGWRGLRRERRKRGGCERSTARQPCSLGSSAPKQRLPEAVHPLGAPLSNARRPERASLAARSPLTGMTALMPPMACTPRRWHVWMTSCEAGRRAAMGGRAGGGVGCAQERWVGRRRHAECMQGGRQAAARTSSSR